MMKEKLSAIHTYIMNFTKKLRLLHYSFYKSLGQTWISLKNVTVLSCVITCYDNAPPCTRTVCICMSRREFVTRSTVFSKRGLHFADTLNVANTAFFAFSRTFTMSDESNSIDTVEIQTENVSLLHFFVS